MGDVGVLDCGVKMMEGLTEAGDRGVMREDGRGAKPMRQEVK